MRVLMISGSYPPIDCGIRIHTVRLSRMLKHQHPELELKILTSHDADRDDLSLPRVKRWTISALPIVSQTIREFGPDLIHIEYPSVMYRRHVFINLLPLWLRLTRPRLPVLLTIHEYHDASRLGRLRILFTILGSRRTVVSNEEDYEALHRLLPFKQLSIIRISPSFSPFKVSRQELDQLRQQHQLTNKQLVFYFGTVEPKKGLHNLLKSVPKWPKPSKLIIGGLYKDYEPYHRALARRIKALRGQVEWVDNPSDQQVSALLQLADVVVLPYNQPASLRRSTMLAAFDHARPTIVTGPVRPPLQDRVNCYLIQPNTPTQITSAVKLLLSDAKLAKLLSVNSRVLAKQFSWAEIAKQYYAAYAKLVR